MSEVFNCHGTNRFSYYDVKILFLLLLFPHFFTMTFVSRKMHKTVSREIFIQGGWQVKIHQEHQPAKVWIWTLFVFMTFHHLLHSWPVLICTAIGTATIGSFWHIYKELVGSIRDKLVLLLLPLSSKLCFVSLLLVRWLYPDVGTSWILKVAASPSWSERLTVLPLEFLEKDFP